MATLLPFGECFDKPLFYPNMGGKSDRLLEKMFHMLWNLRTKLENEQL